MAVELLQYKRLRNENLIQGMEAIAFLKDAEKKVMLISCLWPGS